MPHFPFLHHVGTIYVFFTIFLNTWCTLMRYLCSSKGCPSPSTPKPSCMPWLKLYWVGGDEEPPLFANPPLGSWNATSLSFTCSLCSSISNEGNLEDMAIQPTWEPHSSHLDAFPNHLYYSYYHLKNNISHVAKHIRMCYPQRLICSPFPIAQKCHPKLMSINTSFTYRWKFGIRYLVRVHTTHRVMNCMHTFHIQMLKPTTSNSRALSFFNDYAKLVTSAQYTLKKNIQTIFFWYSKLENCFGRKRWQMQIIH